METAASEISVRTRQQLARELGLIRGAIAMVATHASRRVTVGGLRFGEELLPEAEGLGRSNGVTVRALWKVIGPGCDIVVEARG